MLKNIICLLKQIYKHTYTYILGMSRIVQFLDYCQLSMAMNMLFMMVRHAQKVKAEAENLNPSIPPRGHRVRLEGGIQSKYMQNCK